MPQSFFAEGGGRFSPFRESFLERVVNVSWQSSGAIFVSGDFCCFQRAVRLEKADSKQEWVGLGALDFDAGGGTFASAYGVVKGQPTFVIGGHRGRDGAGLVMVSHDGFNWKLGNIFYQGGLYGSNTYVSNLVWDADPQEHYTGIEQGITPGEGLFYVQIGVGSSNAQAKLGRTYYSPDGIFWYASGTPFADHCKVIKSVPDGVFGYDPKQDLLMFPGESSVPNIGEIFYQPNELPYDAKVVYIITDASTKFSQVFPMTLSGTVKIDDFTPDGAVVDWEMTDHIAVAYCGGIWMVGGGGTVGSTELQSMTVSSIDGGNNWFLSTYGAIGETDEGRFYVETMIGGPIRDFKGQPAAVSGTAVTAQKTEQDRMLLRDVLVKTGNKRPPS